MFRERGFGGGKAVSITRPNDSSSYSAGDVIGAATGASAAIEFTNMAPPRGGEVMLTSSSLEIDVAAIPSGMTSFILHLYSVTPPSALGDNVAWDLPSGDRSSYLGFVQLGSPADLGSTLYCEANGINKQVTLTGSSIFAYLVTNGAYAPSAQAVKKVGLHSMIV
jgi:hypothetical protein